MSKKIGSLKDSNRVSLGRAIIREIVKSKGTFLAFVLFTVIVLTTVVGSLFVDLEEVYKINYAAKWFPPLSSYDGKLYLLGTDISGKDIFKLLLVATRNSLFIGWSIAIVSGIIGISIGMISGYFGGMIDNAIMRVIDFLIIIPALMFQIVMITTMENYTVLKFVMILVLFQWLRYVRIIRAKALQESAQEYILASQVLGTPKYKIILREMMPNLMSIILLRMTLAIAFSIGIETGLTYLGYGLPANTPSLGSLLVYAKNSTTMENYPWTWLPAVTVILVLMLSINALGQALKRAFDSRQRI